MIRKFIIYKANLHKNFISNSNADKLRNKHFLFNEMTPKTTSLPPAWLLTGHTGHLDERGLYNWRSLEATVESHGALPVDLRAQNDIYSNRIFKKFLLFIEKG